MAARHEGHPRRGRLWFIAAVVLACSGAAACAGQDSTPAPAASTSCACAGAEPVVDPVLLAFLSKARATHHQADLAETSGDRDRAVRILEGLVQGPHPGSPEPLREAAEVLADTHARLADLRSSLGDFNGAVRDIEQGLRLAVAPTYFRGNLLDVHGLVEQRRAKALQEAGDAAGAEQARQAAFKLFDEAIAIHEEVLSRALGGDTEPPKPPAR
jgi:tetratricopeptide (TPR) repeat protein